MAEQLSIRQVTLASGTTLSFDGTKLVLDGTGPVIDVAADETDALLWLIKGDTRRRRSAAKPSGRKPSKPAVTEPRTEVPS